MEQSEARVGFSLVFGLVLLGMLSACGSPEHDSTVPVNLSLVVDSTQAQKPTVSPLMAFIQRWVIGGADVWAQAVSDIRTIQVQVLGPDIPVPPTTSVSVTNPSSGQVIPVSIQAPVGPNRTITVAAFNGATPPQKVFSGSAPNVTLSAGTPVDLTVTLARTVTITVTKQGAGSGTVNSTPAGIDCGATCSNRFDAATSVTLNAAPASDSSFAGWSGACTGTAPCTVTLPANPGNNTTVTVTATFNSTTNTRHLTVVKSGTGTVTSNPSGISCGTTCEADFSTGSIVVLTAAPPAGSTFTGWSGAGCSGNGSCTVVMNADQTVTASFGNTLTVTKAGVGMGTVTSNPVGIDCGPTCSFGFAPGTSVTLTATATAGSTFAGWSGSGCSGTSTCVVVMSTSRSVTATFNAVPSTLTVTKMGGGAGTVASSPSGINCGSTCSASFPAGSTVSLTAFAGGGSIFAGWSGGGCSGTGSCTTVMPPTGQTVVATFSLFPSLTVNKTGSGDGTVMSSPASINCGSICTANFAQGTVVTLTASPNGNSNFTGWSAPCAGTGSCVITLTANTTVGAQFTSK
jgi:List-Bact-rpt repeat protein